MDEPVALSYAKTQISLLHLLTDDERWRSQCCCYQKDQSDLKAVVDKVIQKLKDDEPIKTILKKQRN